MLNRMLIGSLAAVLLLTGLSLPANGAAKGGDDDGGLISCTFTGVINMFAEEGEEVEVPTDPSQLPKIRDFYCKHDNGLRLNKLVGDTLKERKALVAFAQDYSHKNYPTVVCKVDDEKTRVFNLAYFLRRRVEEISELEKEKYEPWAVRYSENQGCDLFR